jgi:hypothetical protein
VEEEADMASVETKNTRQDSTSKTGGKNIERGPIIQTGKKVAINKYNLVKRGTRSRML